MTTFAIDIGHNCPPDTGAIGLLREDDLVSEVGEKIITRLSCLGHRCIRTKPTSASSVFDSLRKRASTANANNVDVVVSIHFNASKSKLGKGTETFYISDAGFKLATAVNSELVKLGFVNRGPKFGKWYLLRNTKAPAILVEVCFCDNADDVELLKEVGLDAVANAIVAGLTD